MKLAAKELDPAKHVTPSRGNMLVKTYRSPEDFQTEAGVIVHKRGREAEMETSVRALVLAVGKEVKDYTAGDWVMYGRFSGTNISTSQLGDAEHTYQIISHDMIICKQTKEWAHRELGLDNKRLKVAVRAG